LTIEKVIGAPCHADRQQEAGRRRRAPGCIGRRGVSAGPAGVGEPTAAGRPGTGGCVAAGPAPARRVV